jgi:hypothetical protein
MLEVVERELREPRPDEVRVRVQAASVSLVDEPDPEMTAASSLRSITRGRTPPASVSQTAPVWRATPAARAAAVIVAPRRNSAQNTSRSPRSCGRPTDGPWCVPSRARQDR